MSKPDLIWDGTQTRLKAPSTRDEQALNSDANKLPDTLSGSCHCQKVRFDVKLKSETFTALDCNCSICAKKGFLHLTVPQERVSISDEALKAMTTYRFGSEVAQHTFCSTCGVQPLYVPRSNPECYAVNVRCLELGGVVGVELFEGKSFGGRLEVGKGQIW